jgi:hypothetical protein
VIKKITGKKEKFHSRFLEKNLFPSAGVGLRDDGISLEGFTSRLMFSYMT